MSVEGTDIVISNKTTNERAFEKCRHYLIGLECWNRTLLVLGSTIYSEKSPKVVQSHQSSKGGSSRKAK